MTGFHDLEGQLLDAIERRGSRRSHRASAIVVVASSTLVAALAIFAIVLLGHAKPPPSHPAVVASQRSRHHGQTGNGQGRQLSFTEQMRATALGSGTPAQLKAVSAAINAVQSKDHQCRLVVLSHGSKPSFTQRTPSATMLSVLGVLRRPATPADELPGPVAREPFPSARDIYARYIRLARVVNGVSYYIIPAARAGSAPPPAWVLDRCYAEEMHALRDRLRNVSASLRASTLGVGAKIFTQERASRASQRVHEGVFFLEWRRGSGGGGGGESPQMIAQRGAIERSGNVFDGIAPSGIATVTLEFPATAGSKHAPRTVLAPVVNNVFVATVPGAGAENFPPKMVWRAANGRVIKTVSAP
jgi:hypothetical protein